MSKALYICYRDGSPDRNNHLASRLRRIAEQTLPDHLHPPAPLVQIGENCAYVVANPSPTIGQSGDALLLGKLFETNQEWHRPGNTVPDGSYALFRADGLTVELVADPAGSRTIWYCKNDTFIAAATSQRMLVQLLGEFEFEPSVIPWILSAGTPGPVHGWDSRFSRTDAGSLVRLDRKNWTLQSRTPPVHFRQRSQPSDPKSGIKSLLAQTFERLEIDFERWFLPLSGGYDSRGMLFFLLNRTEGSRGQSSKAGAGPVTFTYGLESSLHEPGNDVSTARELAAEQGVENRFFPTDLSTEPIERIIDRFLSVGEGRSDRIAGYMDGFRMWKEIHEGGIFGILRGDEGFGWVQVDSAEEVRESVELTLCSDFRNLDLKKYGLPQQTLPAEFERRSGESPEQWRDRLYHQYRLPTVLAGLNDLKLSYVELICPLLSGKVLESVRNLPDELRTDKVLYRSIVDEFGSKIPYAVRGGGPWPGDVLSRPDLLGLIRKTLDSSVAGRIFTESFLAEIRTAVDSLLSDYSTSVNGNSDPDRTAGNEHPAESRAAGSAKTAAVPERSLIESGRLLIRKAVYRLLRRITGRRPVRRKLDPRLLAFRVFLIIRMHEILEADAAFATRESLNR